MRKPKICVYSICKNETKFINRWMKSAEPADYRVVLDTGSTDQSFEMLQSYSNVITAQHIIEPFKFDVARNEALSMIPEDTDICITMDMDETLSDGWREAVEKAWVPGTGSARCKFVYGFNEKGEEAGVFTATRMHARKNYTWTHSIHEVITYIGSTPEKVIFIPGMQFNHLPDPTKPRHYLEMLQRATDIENPDARDMYYLGREYMYHEMWYECIDTLYRYMSIKNYNWNEEYASAYRFISKSYINLNQTQLAIKALDSAIKLSPFTRECYIDLAYIYINEKEWEKAAVNIDKALLITRPSDTFVNVGYAWDATVYDLGVLAFYYSGQYSKALECANKCVETDKDNERFINNLRLVQQKIASLNSQH